MENNVRNFISADFRFAKNSYDEYFEIGDEVTHEDMEDSKAIIEGFSIDSVNNEIKAHTLKGWALIDFIYK